MTKPRGKPNSGSNDEQVERFKALVAEGKISREERPPERPLTRVINSVWDKQLKRDEIEYVEQKYGPLARTLTQLAGLLREGNRGARAEPVPPKTHRFVLQTEPEKGWPASLSNKTFKPVIRAIISARMLRPIIESVVGTDQGGGFHKELCRCLGFKEVYYASADRVTKATLKWPHGKIESMARRLDEWNRRLVLLTKPTAARDGDEAGDMKKQQEEDGQHKTDVPDYRALNLAERTVTIGARTYNIISENVWNFLKDLCSALRDDRLVPRFDGARDNKNNVDQLRRQIGKDDLHKLIKFVNGGYKLDPDVKILWGGQIDIRKTHLSHNRK